MPISGETPHQYLSIYDGLSKMWIRSLYYILWSSQTCMGQEILHINIARFRQGFNRGHKESLPKLIFPLLASHELGILLDSRHIVTTYQESCFRFRPFRGNQCPSGSAQGCISVACYIRITRSPLLDRSATCEIWGACSCSSSNSYSNITIPFQCFCRRYHTGTYSIHKILRQTQDNC